jgi:hypothetical protein
MLSYFPQIYPDELLYSVLARYHRHTCSSSPKQTLDDLFGSRNVRASIALQGSIGSLCERIPPARRLTPRRLALENTLFPYYTAFEPAVVGRMVLEAMSSGSIEGVHVRLGIAASKVPVPGYLRYCPACRSEMSKGQGELYWRRAHQLPGALVCSGHGAPLADSRVRIADLGQHEFVGADTENCPPLLPVPEWASDQAAMRQLRRISVESALLLTEQGHPIEFGQQTLDYRQALAERGFARGRRQIAWDRLNAAFDNLMRPVLDIVPGAARRCSGDDWLMGMARKHRKAFHPLRHVLFRLFLADTPIIRLPPVGQRSSGPALAKRDREEVRALWLDACIAHPDWSRKHLAKGYRAEFSWLYRHDRQWLQENSPAPLERSGCAARVDWPAVDRQLAADIPALAGRIKSVKPPVRVSFVEIERGLSKPGWISKRAQKLPLTVAAVNEVVEGLDDFQLRRIHWAADELQASGLPCQGWRICRLAGLPAGLSPRVEAHLAWFDTPKDDIRWC